MARQWELIEYSLEDFRERLGLDKKAQDIEVFVYPNRVVVTTLKRQ